MRSQGMTSLTMYVGAASQHVLRMNFVPEQEAHIFDRQVTTFWSRLIQRDIASPFKSQVTTCSHFPSEAMLWITEVEMVGSLEQLKSSRSVSGKDCPEFWNAWTRGLLLLWTRSSRIRNSRRRSVSRNRKPRRRTSFYEQDRSPSWSTTTCEWLVLMIQYWIMLIFLFLFAKIMFRNSKQHGTKFCYLWPRFPSDDILESLYKLAQLKTVLELYDMEIHQKISMPNFQKNWRQWWRGSIEQKLRLRNFDARNKRIETGAVVKSREGSRGVEGGKGTCYQWKEKGLRTNGDQCSFRHESNDGAQKPDHNAATPSEPSLSRGRSMSKKRSIQGKSNHGAILRRPCRYYLKGTCTRSPCEYWHPPQCEFYKTETGCKARDKCFVPAS